MVSRVRLRTVVVVLAVLTVTVPALPAPSVHAATPRAQAAPATQTGQSTVSAPDGRVAVGSEIYRKVGCFQCHSNEAQGGANGPRIGPDPIPFARFARYIRTPTGSMPPYAEKVLSAQDIADIYAFLRARARPPALDSIPELAP
jgi:mono/diheme cytochrome c family protein